MAKGSKRLVVKGGGGNRGNQASVHKELGCSSIHEEKTMAKVVDFRKIS